MEKNRSCIVSHRHNVRDLKHVQIKVMEISSNRSFKVVKSQITFPGFSVLSKLTNFNFFRVDFCLCMIDINI